MNNPDNKTLDEIRDSGALQCASALRAITVPRTKVAINPGLYLGYQEGFDASTAIWKERTDILVKFAEQALRQWHMHMTDLQRDDLEELLKDEKNIEAQEYKRAKDFVKEFKDLK